MQMTAALSGGAAPMIAAKVALDTAKSAALAAYRDRFTQQMSALLPGGRRSDDGAAAAAASTSPPGIEDLVHMLEVDSGVAGRYDHALRQLDSNTHHKSNSLRRSACMSLHVLHVGPTSHPQLLVCLAVVLENTASVSISSHIDPRRFIVVLDKVLRKHRGTTVFHGWPERGIYQLSSDAQRAPLPALLSRANFLTVLRFPSRGHAAGFLAAEDWHALCFDCVADGAVLEVKDDRGGPLMRPLASIGHWLLRMAYSILATVVGSDDDDDGDYDHHDKSNIVDAGEQAEKDGTAASRNGNGSISDEEKLSARLYGAMAVALMRDGPVLVLQASVGEDGRLQRVPGAVEMSSFAVTTAFDLAGQPLLLRQSCRLKLLRCQSLASVVLQAARTPVPSADLIPTRQILSKL